MVSGIFNGLTLAQLYDLRDSLVSRGKGDVISSVSYSGVSTNFAPMDFATFAAEVAYSIRLQESAAQGKLPLNRVYINTKSRN